jgi:hypothetical protein
MGYFLDRRKFVERRKNADIKRGICGSCRSSIIMLLSYLVAEATRVIFRLKRN